VLEQELVEQEGPAGVGGEVFFDAFLGENALVKQAAGVVHESVQGSVSKKLFGEAADVGE